MSPARLQPASWDNALMAHVFHGRIRCARRFAPAARDLPPVRTAQLGGAYALTYNLAMIRIALCFCLGLSLVACAAPVPSPEVTRSRSDIALFPGETPEMRALVNRFAEVHDLPPSLLHHVIQRESDYRAEARNGPYWGLMQILPETARTMGHRGPAEELLDPEVNLTYAGRYLKGAWRVADGDEAEAVQWYARGYYYEARDRCLLVETGLRDSEVARHCL